MSFVTATFLRLNNIGMVDRRNAVLAADKVGDDNITTSRLYDLQRYASAHANADTGEFYLQGQYSRDAQSLVDAAASYDNPNGNINVKAEAVCKPQYKVWSEAYVQCFADELAKYPPSPNPAENVTLPNSLLYRYSYVSPFWSFDFAGVFALVCVLIVLMILLRLIGLGVLRLLLKRHYRGI